MSSTSPFEMDYTNRDYDSIRTFLVSAARGMMPEWLTAGEPADMGTLLLELYAYVGDILNFYIDRVAAEPFLATAVRRQSILGIADMLGYVPIAQQSATGLVTFSLDDAYYVTDYLEIPTGTILQTEAGNTTGAVYFETVGNTLLGGPGGLRSGDAAVEEGRTIDYERLASSTGAPLQEYVLLNAGVVHRSINMQVQETDDQFVTWSFVDRLTDSGPDASVFSTYIDDQLFLHVLFGDNVAGRIPPVGSLISCSYRYGKGALGNVAPATISLVTPPISGVRVTNVAGLNGGADNESIDQMRYSIPRASKLRDRAVTLQDFADLAFRVPGVAKATAIGEFYTQVKVYIAPVGGGYPSDELRNAVDTYLTDRTLVGVEVEVHPLNTSEWLYQHMALTIEVHVLAQYGQLTVTNAVEAALTSLFSFDRVGFGQRISQGDVYHTCLNVTGVDFIVVQQMQLKNQAGTVIAPTIGDLTVGPTLIPALTVTDDATNDLHITAVGGLT